MNDLEKRINELEIKFSYQDELVSELNLIVANQQNKIDGLVKKLKSLSEKVSLEGPTNMDKDEKPPHY